MTTNYLVDTNNHTGYAQVVEETVGGAVQKQFTFGHDLISQRTGGNVNFYQYDGHGSVRQLTDQAGSVTDAYTYDAFGNLITRIGTTSNDYLYAGEQFDANLGFYYLRARYMNPSSGRFHSMDEFEGNSEDPISLHKYLYANADGVNIIDPSGHFSIVETTIVGNIASTLSNIQANLGFAVADQITYGGDAGFISLAASLIPIAGVAIAIGARSAGRAIAAIARQARAYGPTRGFIILGALDELNRATGARARITREMLPVPNTRPNLSDEVREGVRGFENLPEGNRARGHLVGHLLGGASNDLRNFVPLYQSANNNPNMLRFEQAVKATVSDGEIVDLWVVPQFRNNEVIPVGVTMRARGDRGFALDVTVRNIP